MKDEESTKTSTKTSLILIIFAIATIMGLITFETGSTNSNDVIYVSPSGDTTDVTDADNIEDALLAVAAGGTVVLTEGHFYSSRSLTIENFHGTFKGQGKDETTIEAVRGPEGQGFTLAYDPNYDLWIPALVWFYQPNGDIQVTDLTAQVIEPNLCDPYTLPWFEPELTALCNFFCFTETNYNTELNSLRIKGALVDPFPGFNVLYPCLVEFSEGGIHLVQNCDFEYVYFGSEFYVLTNSKIIIKKNTFTQCYVGTPISYVTSSEIIIKENTYTECVRGISIGGITNSQIIIRDNSFVQGFFGIATFFLDNAKIKENDISQCFIGVYLYYVSDSRVQENEIEDSTQYGIALVFDSSDNRIIDNEVENSGEYDLFWDGTGEGNIWRENEFDTSNF
ncbi:MAG: right-handed parallel beta-helix repeat-containing protein [Candidatus Heimdallarchaeota archaeon]|nr:MAG: right-handed parallel beta-helix repeat-containing protein [Candidatus Heimdallarchaeota archaeon]